LVLEVVLYICNPVAGLAMESLCTVVILGIKKPLVVEVTSNFAEAFGVVVPMPIWAWVIIVNNNNTTVSNFFMRLNF
jgi:hypothetical protein